MGNESLNEQKKVHALYDLIGNRGLYVNTSFDIFTRPTEKVALSGGAGYKLPLMNEGSAYASPLLFATLTSLLNNGTMLITGAPGIGKTTIAEFTGHFFTGTNLSDILAASIKGHPQLTEEKMVARYKIGKLITTGEEDVSPRRFLECPVRIIDEGNRMPPDTISLLMDVVDRGNVVYGDVLLRAKSGPLFVTANYADEGTFEFTPPFLDRFDVAVMVTSPQPWDLTKIRGRGDEKLNGNLETLLIVPEELKLDFGKIRKEIIDLEKEIEYEVPTLDTFADFVYASLRFSEAASNNIARTTKGNAWHTTQDNAPLGHFVNGTFMYTNNELSVRTVNAMERLARAYAWFIGKNKVGLSELKTILPYLLWHKIQPTSKALAENPKFGNDRISFVEDLVQKIETDYTEMIGSNTFEIYHNALRAIRTGKLEEKNLSYEEIRKIAKNAINQIGNADKPWAITLSYHLASTYNTLFNGRK